MSDQANPAQVFAQSVRLAKQLQGQGLPVAGAEHDGLSLAVVFKTPAGARATISVPFNQRATAEVFAQLRARDLAEDGFK